MYNIITGLNGQYYFNLKAENNEIILQSEGYKSKQGSLNGIKSVQVHSQDITNFEERDSKQKEPYFVLKSKNGEIIGVSEMYKSKHSMKNGIETVMKNGCLKEIWDTTSSNPYKIPELIDVEDCLCNGTIPGLAYQYIIRINREKFTVDEASLTGSEILALVGKTPNSAFLRQKIKGSKLLVEADDIIDFTQCGVERFITQDKDCTEGLVQEAFILPREDCDFLNSLGLVWTTIVENNIQWLLIREYPIPKGYNLAKADLALMMQPNYPVNQIDMVYFYPPLQRCDNKVVGALSSQNIEGRIYQRWSRHRDQTNQWIPGEDNIMTHLDLMIDCLKEEFKKR